MATAMYISIWTIICLLCSTECRPFSDLYMNFILKNYPDLFGPRNPDLVQENRRLLSSPSLVNGWPDKDVNVGQVGGVAVDKNGEVLVFHRGSRTWDGSSFVGDIYADASTRGAIPEKTILRINNIGNVVESFGHNRFYMPHGLTVDKDGNLWVTDVAMHQVMKIPKGQHDPTLILGEFLVPGKDDKHFCKPTDVAVTTNGDFFVADGYCNGRIMKFDKNGTVLTKWGRQFTGPVDAASDDEFYIPHSLALDEENDEICVADREHGRIQCFDAGIQHSNRTGNFKRSIRNPQFGRVYAISNNPRTGLMYAVNGPTYSVRNVLGFTLAKNGAILDTWSPNNQGFGQPHDVAVSPDGWNVYVGEISPDRLTKFRLQD